LYILVEKCQRLGGQQAVLNEDLRPCTEGHKIY